MSLDSLNNGNLKTAKSSDNNRVNRALVAE